MAIFQSDDPPESLLNRLSNLRNWAYVREGSNLDYTEQRNTYEQIAALLRSRNVPNVPEWEDTILPSTTPSYAVYDPRQNPSQIEASVFGVDFETYPPWKDPNPQVDIPLELGFQRFRWNTLGTNLSPVKDQGFRALIRPNDPNTGEPSTDEQIQIMLNKEVQPGVTLGKNPKNPKGKTLTSLSIQMWKNPTRHGYAGVYSPQQIGSILAGRLMGESGEPATEIQQQSAIIGHNAAAYDAIILDRLLKEAKARPLTEQNIPVGDTYQMAIAAGVPIGQRSLTSIYPYLGKKFPGRAHTGMTDALAAVGIFPELLNRIHGGVQTQPTGRTNLPITPRSPINLGGAGSGGSGGSGGDRPTATPGNTPWSPFEKQSVADFEADVRKQLVNRLGADAQINFRPIRDDVLRVSVLPYGQKEALVLDIAPGYNTPLGHGVELVSGSKWRGLIGPEGVALSDEDIQIRSPMEAFGEYVGAAYSKEMTSSFAAWSPQRRFMTLINLGQNIAQGMPIAGGVMWAGPVHTERAKAEMATRMNIGIAPGIKNRDTLFTSIFNRIQVGRTHTGKDFPEYPMLQDIERWGRFQNFVPVSDDSGRTRLRQLGLQGPNETILLGTSNLSKAIKRANVEADVRERGHLLEYVPETGGAQTAVPKPISATDRSWQGIAGYRMLGGTMPGERERYVGIVQPNVAVMSNPILSGAMITYEDVLKDYISGGYQKEMEVEMPQLTAHQLRSATWEWGRFRETKSETGESTFEKIAERTNVISPEESAIIGLLNYDVEGTKTTAPLRIGTSGRPVFPVGKPILDVPLEFSFSTGRGVAGVPTGEEQPRDVGPMSLYLDEIQKNFGGDIRYATGSAGVSGETTLRVPVEVGGGISAKGPFKVTMAPATKPWGFDIRNKIDIALEGGGLIQRQISGITGDLKQRQRAWVGHVLSRTPEVREQMLGEFYRINPEMAKELQAYQRTQAAQTVTEMWEGKPIETYGGFEAEEFGRIYSKHMGVPYVYEETATRAYEHLRQIVTALPVEERIQKYDYGPIPRTTTPEGRKIDQPYSLGMVSESEMRNMRLRYFRGARTALAKPIEEGGLGLDIGTPSGARKFRQVYPGGIKGMWEDMFQFEKLTPTVTPEGNIRYNIPKYAEQNFPELMERSIELPGTSTKPVSLPNEQMYLGAVRAPADLMTFVSPVVPEHLSQLPALDYEVMRSLTVAAPELADFLGLSVRSMEGAEGTGIYPSHARAWREIAEVGRAMDYPGPIRYLPYTKTGEPNFVTLDEERIGTLQGMIETGASMEQLEKTISGWGQGPLYMEKTGLLFPRPGTMQNLSAFEYELESGEKQPLGKAARMYPSGLQQFLGGMTRDMPGSRALREVLGMSSDVFRSGGRSVEKLLGARFSHGITGRYGAMMGLPLGVGMLPAQSVDTMLTKLAEKSKMSPTQLVKNPLNPGESIPWITLAKRQIEEAGYAPGAYGRYPNYMGIGGVSVIPWQTEETLRRRGLSYPGSTTTRGNVIRPGSALTTGYIAMVGPYPSEFQQGDYDADLATALLAAEATEEGIRFHQGTDTRNRMQMTGMERLAEMNTILKQAGLSTLNPMEKELGGLVQSFLTGETGNEPGAPGSEPFVAHPYSKGFNEALAIEKTVQGMGVAYNAKRLIEASATAMGWEPDVINKGTLAQSYFYQTYLDKLTHYVSEIQRGGFRSTETILNTGIFATIPEGKETRLLYKPDASTKHKVWWQTTWGERLNEKTLSESFSRALGRGLTEAVATDVANMAEPNYGLAAYLMATEAKDVDPLAQRMRELAEGGMSPKEAVRAALWSPGDINRVTIPHKEGYYATHDVTRSPLGAAAIVSAYGRTQGWLGKPPKSIDVEGEPQPLIPRIASQTWTFQGRTMSIGQLGEDPVVRRILGFYGYQTRKYGYPSPEGKTIFASIPTPQLAEFSQFRRELMEAGKPVPDYLNYIVGQENAEAAEVSMQYEGVRMRPTSDQSRYTNLVTPNMYLGSSKAHFLAREGGYGISGNEEVMRNQARIGFMASNIFGIDEELLMSEKEIEERRTNFMKGTTTEAIVAPEIAERFGMFKRETKFGREAVEIGPIYGVPHETRLGGRGTDWVPSQEVFPEEMKVGTPLANAGTLLHYAPDIFGVTGFGTANAPHAGLLRASIKFSSSEAAAQAKATSYAANLQETTYNAIEQAKARNITELRTLLEPQIRETPWFKESWSEEALRKITLPSGKKLTEEEINAEQQRIVRKNVSMIWSELQHGPVESRMFAFTGDPNAPQAVGTPEQQMLGIPMRSVGNQLYMGELANAVIASEAMNTPQAIADYTQRIYSKAVELGVPPLALGTTIAGLYGTAPEPRLMGAEKTRYKWSTLTSPIGQKGKPGFNLGAIGAFNFVQGTTGQPPAGGQPPGGGSPTVGAAATPNMPKPGDYIPFYNPEGQLTMRMSPFTEGGIPLSGLFGGMGGSGQGGEGFTREQELKIISSHYGPGQDPHMAALKVAEGLTAAQAVNIPEFAGEPGGLPDWETRMQIKLGGMIGLRPHQALGLPYVEVLARAVQLKGYTPQMRQLLMANRRYMESGTNAISALNAGLSSGKRLPFSEEGMAQAAAIMNMPPQEAQSITEASLAGLTEYQTLGRNLQAAYLTKKVADDKQLLAGGMTKPVTEDLEKFSQAIQGAYERLNKYNDVLESTTATTQEKAAARSGADRAILEIEKQQVSMGVKISKGYWDDFQEALRTGTAEGYRPQDIGQAAKSLITGEKQIASIEKRQAKLEEEELGFTTGARRAESGSARFFRRALGGFGLMYLQSLAGVATSGWGYGQGERITMEQAMMQQQAAGTGVSYFMPNQQQTLATQIAVQGAAINPSLWLQSARANVPLIRDVWGAGAAGLGAYAGLQWYGSFSEPTSFLREITQPGGYTFGQKAPILGALTGGRGINLTAGKIAAAVAAIQVGGQMVANAQDQEGLAYNVSKPGAQGFWAGTSLTQSIPFAYSYLTNPEFRETSAQYMEMRQRTQAGQDILGQINQLAPRQQAESLTRATRVLIGEYPQYSPDVTAAIANMMYRTGIPSTPENIEKFAAQYTTGVANEPLMVPTLAGLGYSGQQMYAPGTTDTYKTRNLLALQRAGGTVTQAQLQSTRTSMMGAVLTDLSDKIKPYERQDWETGQAALGQLGEAAYYLPGLGAGGGQFAGPDALKGYMLSLGQLAVTPGFGLYQQQMQGWNLAQSLGINRQAPNLPTGSMTEKQLYAAKMNEQMRNAPLLRQDTYQQQLAQSLEGMLTAGQIQDYANLQAGGSGFQNLSMGQQISETERVASIGNIRVMRERYGMSATPREMRTLLGRPKAEIQREEAQLTAYGKTKEELTTLGYSEQEAVGVASWLRGTQLRGPQGEMLAEQARGQLGQAAYLGLDINKFTEQLTKGVQQAVVGGMALGLAQQAAGLGMNAQQTFDFAAQGFQQTQVAGMGLGVAQRVANVTGNMGAAGRLYQAALGGGYEGAQFLQRMFNFEPLALTQAASQGAAPNWMATTNITLGGAVTSQPLFTSSMMQGQMNMGPAVLGPLANTQAGQAAQFGFNILTGQTYTNQQQYAQGAAALRSQGYDANQFIRGGLQGLQWLSMQKGFEYQQASAGVALAQIALQEKYTPQFWAIEDKQRALQDRQAQWGFQMQAKQMEMSRSQFFENIGFNQQQAQVQRQWTMQDWGYQNQVRQMQWGWRQEDFAENVRFMTGRERKLAERQMERETTMFGMEGDRIEEQKKRQKEMWAMEDQRFEMQKKQFLEQLELQDENLKKQREFYDDGKKLRDEQVKLQRAYWRENIELQKQAAGASAAYAKDMQEIQRAMQLVGQAQDDYTDRLKVATTNEFTMINALIGGLNWVITKAPDALKSIVGAVAGTGGVQIIPPLPGQSTGGGGGSNGPKPQMQAIGGPKMPGTISIVGEKGAEAIESSIPGGVLPNNELSAMLFGQASNFNSYWNNTYINMNPSQPETKPTVVNVYLGNERIGNFVLDTVKNDLEVG